MVHDAFPLESPPNPEDNLKQGQKKKRKKNPSSKWSERKTSASNDFTMKATGQFSTDTDSVDERNELPTVDCRIPSHAFIEKVLSVCELSASLKEDVMKQLLSRTQTFSPNRVVALPNLSQLSALNETDFNDVDLPSTQPRHNDHHNNQLESREDLISHTCLTPPRRTERLSGNDEPLQAILGFQLKGQAHMVDVRWWATHKPKSSDFWETTKPLRKMMQRKFPRELMRDFLKKEHDDDEQKITDIVGEFNWHWMVTGKRRSNRLLPKGPKKKTT